MKEITATEAARNFSELLDDLEHRGGDYVIVRRGRPVAHLEPIVTGSGSAVKNLLMSSAPDPAWRSDLASVRDLLDLEDRG
ncbi:MAG: type II toxin-antitoxin system Phd/YefM family antitoxin [Acidimicrobiia bacterium]|nr:type II toxin-antitoxin system Phd/YefM family antitoxin [Acidimicrobiia bacterium]